MFAVADMIVIHFAFGSPFGVYQIALGGSMRSPRSAANVALHFVLWPVFALAFIGRWLVEYKRREEAFEDKIADIRTKLEMLVFSANSPASILVFREVFARFTGLTTTLKQGPTTNPSKELLKVSGHTNIAVATACINRRNRQRTLFHQSKARDELIEMMLLSFDPRSMQGTVELVMQLGNLLEDKKTVDDIVIRSGVSALFFPEAVQLHEKAQA